MRERVVAGILMIALMAVAWWMVLQPSAAQGRRLSSSLNKLISTSAPTRSRRTSIGSQRLPEPYSHNRRAWIGNSTTPVTLWYVDHNGYIVRLQPFD
jgi:hypothetical protein